MRTVGLRAQGFETTGDVWKTWRRRTMWCAAGLALSAALATATSPTAHAFSRSSDQGEQALAPNVTPVNHDVPPIPHTLFLEALASYRSHADQVSNARYLAIADFSRHSSERRLFILDLESGTHEALLVAHGQGSDRDHDGYADAFSNVVDSHMSSVGAYVTGSTYQGKHGLSLRLEGLDATNDRAMERAIVIHGADYVDPSRAVLGRSQGCPAIEQHLVEDVVPRLANGSFFYIRGNTTRQSLMRSASLR